MKTNDDLQKLNKEVAEWLGVEGEDHAVSLRPDSDYCRICGVHRRQHRELSNYILHPVDLLREMMKRKDWVKFHSLIGTEEAIDINPQGKSTLINAEIRIIYITDQTGLLLIKVWEWMRKGQTNERT